MEKQIVNIIENNPVALATISSQNTPNVIGTAYAKVVDDKVILTGNYMKQTKENLKNNNNVCLASWDKDWNGYKIVGTAEYCESGKWLDFVKNIPENKDCPAKAAIVITPSQIIKLH